MAQDNNNLIWVDMEMTGLNPDTDRIIEVALVITDSQLNTIAEGPVLVVHQPDEVLNGMDKWNQSTHSKSGLIGKVKASHLNEAEVEAQLIEFLKLHVPIRCIADVRQFNLPGPALHGSLNATIGSLFSLP
jgi:oligoribonuclease